MPTWAGSSGLTWLWPGGEPHPATLRTESIGSYQPTATSRYFGSVCEMYEDWLA